MEGQRAFDPDGLTAVVHRLEFPPARGLFSDALDALWPLDEGRHFDSARRRDDDLDDGIAVYRVAAISVRHRCYSIDRLVTDELLAFGNRRHAGEWVRDHKRAHDHGLRHGYSFNPEQDAQVGQKHQRG